VLIGKISCTKMRFISLSSKVLDLATDVQGVKK